MKVSTTRKCLQAKKHILTPTNHRQYGKPRDLVAGEQGKLWEGQQRKIDSSSDIDRDSKF